MKLQFNKRASLLASAIIIAQLPALNALAQDQATLSADEAARVEQLNNEIRKLSEERDGLTAKLQTSEAAGNADQLAAEAEEIKAKSAEIAAAAEKVEEEVKIWSGDVELGYVSTSGNTEETTTKTLANIKREKDEWRYGVLLESLNSEASGDRSAEKYFFSNRLAYQYSEKNFAFAYASYDDDRFSGFDYQATIAAGYGRRLINDDTMELDIEIGPGYRYSKVDDGSTADDSEEVIVRAFSNLIWDFSDNAQFNQTLNIEAGEESIISKSVSALKVKVIGALSMKLAYTIKYTDEVPDGTKHADTETSVTLNYSF